MNKLAPLLLICILFSCNSDSDKDDKMSNSQRINLLMDSYWQEQLKFNPLQATESGVNDYNDQLGITIASSFLAEIKENAEGYVDELKSINSDSLEVHDLLNYKLFQYQLNRQIKGAGFNTYGARHIERPLDQFVFSFHTNFSQLASGSGFVPFNSVEDYLNFLSRINHFSAWIDTAIVNMRRGMVTGNVNPKASMIKVLPQLTPMFETAVEDHVFYRPVFNMPDFGEVDRKDLTVKYTNAIEEVVKPTYRKLHDFLRDEYIPVSNEVSGLTGVPKGNDEYNYWISFWTTTNLGADSIFSLGVLEVARIRNAMDSLRNSVGFKGDLTAFFKYVKTDRQFFPFNTEEEVLDRYRSFLERMEPQLKEMFNLIPKAEFEVRAIEKYREKGANAHYNSPTPDGRPGIFYEAIPNATNYNVMEMETLFMHEAIPGHHYQVALQLETDMPEWRKQTWFGAYGEGWALYAESLGEELGMFNDPYQKLGNLSSDIERAIRLVVDVGLHYKGWSREKAIQYILDNQPMSEEEAIQRIERYMVTPGQALSYKIGEQKIIQLRNYASAELGNSFDIRAFHDEILRDGGLPLEILDWKVKEWIKRVKR